MPYKLVNATSYKDLIGEVNLALGQGWKLAGGISIASTYDERSLPNMTYTQALYMEKPVLTSYNTPATNIGPINPMPAPVAPQSDQQKLIKVLSEIGIPYKVYPYPDREGVDIADEGSHAWDMGHFTSVNFDTNGKFIELD